jgi:nucleoside-triphosphatase THEP1
MDMLQQGRDATDGAAGHSAAICVALVYDSSADLNRWFAGLVAELRHSGRSLAGLIQEDVPQAGRSRCDMVLHELATGRSMSISEDLGPGAISCRLSTPRLLEAAQLVEVQLADADVVFLNKFGKAEAEGGGLRDLIAHCIESGKSLVIGVPRGNLPAWTEFCGEFFRTVEATPQPRREALAALAALLGKPLVDNGHPRVV